MHARHDLHIYIVVNFSDFKDVLRRVIELLSGPHGKCIHIHCILFLT